MTPLVPTLDISEGLSEKVGKMFKYGSGWCEPEAGESFVVERFWERYLDGGDTLSISEPRLGMGGWTIEGGVTHSRNWQREGATRGRWCTLCEVQWMPGQNSKQQITEYTQESAPSHKGEDG